MIKIPALNDFSNTFHDPVWLAVADTVCKRHDIDFQYLRRTDHGENIVFLADDAYIVKIYTPLKNGFHRERAGLNFAEGKTSLRVPDIVATGEIDGYYYLILTQIRGHQMHRDEWLRLDRPKQTQLLMQLAAGLKELHSADAWHFDFDWKEFIRIQLDTVFDRQNEPGVNPEWLERLPSYLDENLHLLPDDSTDVFQHGDVHFGNLRVLETGGALGIGGLFDFADSICGFHEYEFTAIGVLMIQGQGDLQREFFREYGYSDNEIDENLRKRLMLMTILYEHSSLRRYAQRLDPDAITLNLDELERAIWNFA